LAIGNETAWSIRKAMSVQLVDSPYVAHSVSMRKFHRKSVQVFGMDGCRREALLLVRKQLQAQNVSGNLFLSTTTSSFQWNVYPIAGDQTGRWNSGLMPCRSGARSVRGNSFRCAVSRMACGLLMQWWITRLFWAMSRQAQVRSTFRSSCSLPA